MPGPYADAVFQAGPPPDISEGSFTIAVLPDTQMYGESFPDGFLAQTRWIVDQRKARSIAAVLHLGDITNRNSPEQWEVAQKAMRQLDGEELWQKLVAPNGTFVMALNGHVLRDGLGRIVTKDSKNRDVAQMLVNFQMKPKGGDGWLRLLEFKPDGTTVDVVDFSPTRNECNVSAQNRFTLALPSSIHKTSLR